MEPFTVQSVHKSLQEVNEPIASLEKESRNSGLFGVVGGVVGKIFNDYAMTPFRAITRLAPGQVDPIPETQPEVTLLYAMGEVDKKIKKSLGDLGSVAGSDECNLDHLLMLRDDLKTLIENLTNLLRNSERGDLTKRVGAMAGRNLALSELSKAEEDSDVTIRYILENDLISCTSALKRVGRSLGEKIVDRVIASQAFGIIAEIINKRREIAELPKDGDIQAEVQASFNEEIQNALELPKSKRPDWLNSFAKGTSAGNLEIEITEESESGKRESRSTRDSVLHLRDSLLLGETAGQIEEHRIVNAASQILSFLNTSKDKKNWVYPLQAALGSTEVTKSLLEEIVLLCNYRLSINKDLEWDNGGRICNLELKPTPNQDYYLVKAEVKRDPGGNIGKVLVSFACPLSLTVSANSEQGSILSNEQIYPLIANAKLSFEITLDKNNQMKLSKYQTDFEINPDFLPKMEKKIKAEGERKVLEITNDYLKSRGTDQKVINAKVREDLEMRLSDCLANQKKPDVPGLADKPVVQFWKDVRRFFVFELNDGDRKVGNKKLIDALRKEFESRGKEISEEDRNLLVREGVNFLKPSVEKEGDNEKKWMDLMQAIINQETLKAFFDEPMNTILVGAQEATYHVPVDASSDNAGNPEVCLQVKLPVEQPPIVLNIERDDNGKINNINVSCLGNLSLL